MLKQVETRKTLTINKIANIDLIYSESRCFRSEVFSETTQIARTEIINGKKTKTKFGIISAGLFGMNVPINFELMTDFIKDTRKGINESRCYTRNR